MINKVNITDAGPIKNKELAFTDFNLIYGKNEAGKTAIADMLSQILITDVGTAEINKFKGNTGYNKDRFSTALKYSVEGKNNFELRENTVLNGDIISLSVIRAGEAEIKIGKERDIAASSYWSAGIKTLFDGKDETVKRLEKITTLFTGNSKIWSVLQGLKNHKATIEQTIFSYSALIEKKNELADTDVRLNNVNKQIIELESLQHIANLKEIEIKLNSWNETRESINRIKEVIPHEIEKLTQIEEKQGLLFEDKLKLENHRAELLERILSLTAIIQNIESKHKLLIVITALGSVAGLAMLNFSLYIAIASFIIALFSLGQLLVRMKDSRTVKEQIETYKSDVIEQEKKLTVSEHLLNEFNNEHKSLSLLIEKRIMLEQELASLDSLIKDNKQKHEQLCSFFNTEVINYARESYALSSKLNTYNSELLKKRFSAQELSNLLREREILQTNLRKDDVDLANRIPTLLHKVELSYAEISSKIPQNGKNFYSKYLLPHIKNTEVKTLYDLEASLSWCNVAIDEISNIKLYVDELRETINEVLHNQSEYIITIFERTDFKKFFTKLTGYERVEVVTENDEVTLTVIKGEEQFSFDSLSTGTKHQFFFCLRLALLNAITEKPGILILDDAFLHFDKGRRIKGIEILNDMRSLGWQIFYTAVDDDVIVSQFKEVKIDTLNIIAI